MKSCFKEMKPYFHARKPASELIAPAKKANPQFSGFVLITLSESNHQTQIEAPRNNHEVEVLVDTHVPYFSF